MHRRRFVGVVGGGMATIGLAGCLGLGGGGDDSFSIETDSPEAVLESWYQLLYNGDADERADRAGDVWHAESPVMDNDGGNQGGELTGEIDIKEVRVTSEAPTGSEVEEQIGFWANNEQIQGILDSEELAVVEATVEVTLETGQSAGETTERYLAATEDGEWQLVVGPLA